MSALIVRNTKPLNAINSMYIEVGDFLLRGTFIALLFITAVASYYINNMVSFYFFVASRLVQAFQWILMVISLFRKTPHIDDGPIYISQIFKYDSKSSIFEVLVFVSVAAFGVLDPAILRLLPWLPTEFAKSTGGYPNLRALKCCLYLSNLAYIFQLISSVLSLIQSDTTSAFSSVVVIFSSAMMLRVLVETIVNVYKQRSGKFSTILEVDKVNLQSAVLSMSYRLSRLRRLEERLESTDNPLRSTIAPLIPRPSMVIEDDDVEAQIWKNHSFINDCMQTMRGIIPPHIFYSSVASLQHSDGFSALLALRLMSKTSLWLVRVHPDDIHRITAAELLEK